MQIWSLAGSTVGGIKNVYSRGLGEAEKLVIQKTVKGLQRYPEGSYGVIRGAWKDGVVIFGAGSEVLEISLFSGIDKRDVRCLHVIIFLVFRGVR